MTQEEIDALPDTLTVLLPRPVSFETNTWSQLDLREPTAGELEKMAALLVAEPQGWRRKAIALVTLIPERALEKIPARALMRGSDYLYGFMESAQPTSS